MHPVIQLASEVQKLKRLNGHIVKHVAPATVQQTEKYSRSSRGSRNGREHDNLTNDLDENMAIWCIFLNDTLRAAVHLRQDYEANFRYVKNNLWSSAGQLFRETGELISEQKEITGASTSAFKDATWMSTCLLCSKACQFTNAKIYVFSDSVLCVGKMGDDPIATWKSKIG